MASEPGVYTRPSGKLIFIDSLRARAVPVFLACKVMRTRSPGSTSSSQSTRSDVSSPENDATDGILTVTGSSENSATSCEQTAPSATIGVLSSSGESMRTR